MMSEGGFLRSLLEMNCDIITQKQVAQVRAHMKVNYQTVFHFLMKYTYFILIKTFSYEFYRKAKN